VAQPGAGGVPSDLPDVVTTRDQFDLQCVGGDNDGGLCVDSADCPGGGTCTVGSDETALLDTAFHCNPLLEKTVFGVCVDGPDAGLPCANEEDCDGGTCEGFSDELFNPPNFPTQCVGGANDGLACTTTADCPDGTCEFPIAVPAGVEPPEQVHYTCYDIDEEVTEIRNVTVQDQFGINPITIGKATRLCEPAVKDEVEVVQNQCGLLGIEALLGLLPLAYWQRRRARQGREA
jgi:hypothetical protein